MFRNHGAKIIEEQFFAQKLLIPRLHTAWPTEMTLYAATENGKGRMLHAATISTVNGEG